MKIDSVNMNIKLIKLSLKKFHESCQILHEVKTVAKLNHFLFLFLIETNNNLDLGNIQVRSLTKTKCVSSMLF